MSNVWTKLAVTTFVAAAAISWSGRLPSDTGAGMISSAEARIGRPLTPLSYAGVARRTTRRAVAAGAVVGGAAVVVGAPVVVAPVPVCGQVVDVYGRIVTVCR